MAKERGDMQIDKNDCDIKLKWQIMGMTICHTNEFVQSHFLDDNLIVRYINKMGTNGGGGVVDGVTLRRLQAILVPG